MVKALAPLFCTNCGAANQQQARFCFACGHTLQAPDALSFSNASSSVLTLAGHLVPNALLKDRYHILRQLGQGGMGTVYRAADTLFNNRPVAVKEISLGGLNTQQSAEAVNNFKREAHMLVGLSHPNLPAIHDYFSEGGRWYLVMDFIEGQTLEERLDKADGHCLPLEETLALGIELCGVLDYLHTRQPPIIFRDLKPANILQTPQGRLFLIDFGIARHFKPGQAKDTVSFGSSGYAAPEQYGKSQTTTRSDLYSLGALLHQCLSGNDPSLNSPTPFDFPPLEMYDRPAHPLEIPLRMLLEQMLTMNPGARPVSARVIKQELERLATLEKTASFPRNTAPINAMPASARPVYPVLNKQIHTVCRMIYMGHSGVVTAVTWSPDSQKIASASSDGSVQVWRAQDGKHLFMYRGHKGPVYSVTWSPDGQALVSAGRDGTAQVWDAQSGQPLATFSGHVGAVYTVAWSPDNEMVVSGGDDRTVQIWNASNGEPIFTYARRRLSLLTGWGHTGRVRTVAWSSDGRHIASGGEDGTVQVWNWREGKLVLTFQHHQGVVNAVAWSPFGVVLASAGNTSVWVWNTTPGVPPTTLQRHRRSVLTLAWSPDGKHIVVAGRSRRVQVWNSMNDAQVTAYTGHHHQAGVRAVAWSPDGKYIASGSSDKTIHVWELVGVWEQVKA
ncbi:MAG: protein kinase [Chloroflexota bacterium]|nr:protein kinase [Chloroflexota bacterium]